MDANGMICWGGSPMLRATGHTVCGMRYARGKIKDGVEDG